MTPLENAIETMSKTNERLQTLINQFEAHAQAGVSQLSMVLQGVIDAAVSGGIANYKTFYGEQYLDEHPRHDRLVSKLKDATSLQVHVYVLVKVYLCTLVSTIFVITSRI